MSELKAVHAFDVYEAYTKTGDDDATQVYIKSEADKVIAELKAREDVLVTDNRNLLDKVKVLDQRLRETAEHFQRNEAQILENSDKVIVEKDKEITELKAQVNGFHNRANLWHYNAVEEHKKFVQIDLQMKKLKEKHKTEVKELLCLIRDKENNFNRAFDSEEKEIRHHKFKRCLAMAEMCRTNAVLADLLSPKRTSRKFSCWKNRYEKFLELADKFKEAK